MDESVQVPLTRVGCTKRPRPQPAPPAAAPPPPSRLLSLLCSNARPPTRKRPAEADPPRTASTSSSADWLPCPVCGLRLPRGPAFDKHAAAEAATAARSAETKRPPRAITDVLPGRGAAAAPRPRLVDLGGSSGGSRPAPPPTQRRPRTVTLPALPPRFNHYADGSGAWCDQQLGIDGAGDATEWKVGGVAKLGGGLRE